MSLKAEAKHLLEVLKKAAAPNSTLESMVSLFVTAHFGSAEGMKFSAGAKHFLEELKVAAFLENSTRDGKAFLLAYWLLCKLPKTPGANRQAAEEQENLKREIVADLIEQDEPLSDVWRAWLVNYLRAPLKVKGLHVRNVTIVDAVERLSDAFALRPTRNREQKAGESACSIVKEALAAHGLNLTEAAVNQIWLRERKKAPPASPPSSFSLSKTMRLSKRFSAQLDALKSGSKR